MARQTMRELEKDHEDNADGSERDDPTQTNRGGSAAKAILAVQSERVRTIIREEKESCVPRQMFRRGALFLAVLAVLYHAA
ncbi:hypothetical protein [Luteimonas sp. 100069]|uniref:hypothetical protein n=1 Tax=Luteimonas sp. 100069 TaxID=2006109 RepID=UPI000F4DA7DB|nr:hypothetical protein [Luteimonas sp. 100069]